MGLHAALEATINGAALQPVAVKPPSPIRQGGALTATTLLSLQRAAGNAAVAGLLQRRGAGVQRQPAANSSSAPASSPATSGSLTHGVTATGGSLGAADIALRDLYKLANVERASASQDALALLAPNQANQGATIARSVSDARNLLRAATQDKLTPVGKVLSHLLEKNRSWTEIVKRYGDPFSEQLSAETRLGIANRIVAASSRSSRAMNALQAFGKGVMVLNVALSAWEIGGGIEKIRSGQTAEGAIDIAEGTTGGGLTIGTYAGVKSGALVVAEGTAGATFVAGLAAAGSLALGFEESRRAARGEKTMAVEAHEFWKEAQDDATSKGPSVGGAVKYVGAEFGKGLSGFIAAGQDDLWGLLD